MKKNSYQILIGLLVVVTFVLLFWQRRSGYTPSTGAPISLMDLQEFSVFTPEQKAQYTEMLSNSSDQLTQAAAGKTLEAIMGTVSDIMKRALSEQPTTQTDKSGPIPTEVTAPPPVM